MYNTTLADLGTAFVIYQAVYEILDEESRDRLDEIRGDRFDKFKSKGGEIDISLEAEHEQVTKNCEQFCLMALEGMFEMLEKHFPVADIPSEENAPE